MTHNSGLAANASSATFTDTFSTSGLSVGHHPIWVAADNWNNVVESDETNNLAFVNFAVTAPPKPDLIVSLISAVNVVQGSDLSFSYAIKNSGSVAAGQSWSAWHVDQQPTTTTILTPTNGFDYNSGLAANTSSTNFTDSFITTDLSVGQHTLWVAADEWNSVVESDETNNLSSVNFTVTAPAKPDLIVSLISAVNVVQGSDLSFSYAIQNIGSAAAGQH